MAQTATIKSINTEWQDAYNAHQAALLQVTRTATALEAATQALTTITVTIDEDRGEES